jgi:hypothetical protein
MGSEVGIESDCDHLLCMGLACVHELAATVVSDCTTLDFINVFSRHEHEDDVRLVDTFAHGVENIALHVRLV